MLNKPETMNTLYKIIGVVILMYFSWQFGRVADEGIFINKPEQDLIVIKDRCLVQMDTTLNVNTIWYKDVPYEPIK